MIGKVGVWVVLGWWAWPAKHECTKHDGKQKIFLKMDRSDARRQRFKNSPCPGLRRALDTIIETRDEVHLSPSYHNQPYRLDDFSGKPHERKSKILKLGVVTLPS